MRQVAIADDQSGCCVQSRAGRVNELGEGVMIASLRPCDGTLLVHMRLDSGATDSAALYSLWRRRYTNGSPACGMRAGQAHSPVATEVNRSLEGSRPDEGNS